MSEIIDVLKGNVEKVIDEAGSITKAAISKTGESVNVMKLKYAVRDINKDIKSLYSDLGKMLYDEYSSGAEFDGVYKEKCQKITDHLDEISILKQKIADISNQVICSECGQSNKSDSKFCSACGHEFQSE